MLRLRFPCVAVAGADRSWSTPPFVFTSHAFSWKWHDGRSLAPFVSQLGKNGQRTSQVMHGTYTPLGTHASPVARKVS